MRRVAPRSLHGALEVLSRELAPASTLARVQECWERTVGPAIAAAAQPTAERAGVLEVTCEAAVWAQELDLMAGDLIPRLNSALGEPAITALRCLTGLADSARGRGRHDSRRPAIRPFCRGLASLDGALRPPSMLLFKTHSNRPGRGPRAPESGAFSRHRRAIGRRQRQL